MLPKEAENDTVDSATDTTNRPLHKAARNDEDEKESSFLDIKQWLKQLLTGKTTINVASTNKFRLGRTKKLFGISFLALIILGILRRRRRITNYRSSLWPFALLVEWYKGPEYKRNPKESTMSLLYSAARDGIIQQALIGSSTIFYQTKKSNSTSSSGNTQWNRAILPSNNEAIRNGLLETLAATGADVSAIPENIWSKLATPVLAALPFVYLALLYRMMKNQFGGEDIAARTTNGTRNLWGSEEKDRTTFADVAGLDPVIEDLSEVVSYLSNPSLYKSMGARPPRGVLLHGPPGSGKTLLARAVAGEAMCDSFTAVSGSMFVEMYVGRGAARIRSLFAKARRDAIHRRKMNRAAVWWSNLFGFTSAATLAVLERPPCAIVFIDELDAVAKTRSSDSIHGNDEREQTLNELLTEMDGFETGRSKSTGDDEVTLIVIAASNRVDVMDQAVLRRFDRQILVGYPNKEGRKAILRVHAKKVQCSPNIDWDELASSEYTGDFSGADLRNLVNEAALFAIREHNAAVQQPHLMHAARRISTQKTPKVANVFSPAFFANID